MSDVFLEGFRIVGVLLIIAGALGAICFVNEFMSDHEDEGDDHAR